MTRHNKGSVKRPVVRYHGGKFNLAKWIIDFFPPHKIYCEPFGGGGSVLMQKARSYAEIYNDLDDNIVTVFKAYRDHGTELARWLRRTPFSRKIFDETYTTSDDIVERAGKLIYRSFAGFGSAAITAPRVRTGFRANSNRAGTTPAHDWKNYARHLVNITQRLKGVVIENRDAFEIIKTFDSSETLFYLDPPYLPSTRWAGGKIPAYRYEMSEDTHAKLCETLLGIDGFVVISGYENDLYSKYFSGWETASRGSVKSSSRGGTIAKEVIWINPKASRAAKNVNAKLFNELAT